MTWTPSLQCKHLKVPLGQSLKVARPNGANHFASPSLFRILLFTIIERVFSFLPAPQLFPGERYRYGCLVQPLL